jgi:GNAT superfamily N-acetyltransferase
VWHARPLFDEDLDEVLAMVNACELADSGEAMLDKSDVLSNLAGADRDRDACVIVQNGRIVGWGLIWTKRKRWADVHPDARGQGIGTWLLKWAAWRAKQLGADRTGQTIDDARTEMGPWLVSHNYSCRYQSWTLVGSVPGESSATPALPQEYDAVLDLFECAFTEFADRPPVDRARWRARTVERLDFRPEDLVVIRDEGRPVAVAYFIDNWVDNIAVAATHRRRGLATELMRGRGRLELSTDSNTGALGFYERLGFELTRSYTHWAVGA